MQANKIISVRSASGKVLSELLTAFDQFNICHVVKCGGVWSIQYV